MPASRIACITLCRTSGVGLEHREVDVAVAGVAGARDPRARARSAMPRTVARYSGTDARGTTTSMMSFAPFCFATQNAFSRASSSSAAERRRQDVHVERAQLGEQLGDARRRPRRAGRRGAAPSRRRGTPTSRPCTSVGMPRSSPTFAVVAAMLSTSMYSRISGFTPLSHDARHRGRRPRRACGTARAPSRCAPDAGRA